jgi:hypothetical protein
MFESRRIGNLVQTFDQTAFYTQDPPVNNGISDDGENTKLHAVDVCRHGPRS